MIRQNRVSPPDVTLVNANLIKFIGLLKKEAMQLGHPPLRMDSNTLIATKKGFVYVRRRLLLSFGLFGRTILWFLRVGKNSRCNLLEAILR